jgi:SIR2-like domain
MQPHLLLAGAGFSYNWGGYLASEAFEFLLSVTEGDDDLRSLLWREHQAHLGFEDILAKLQREYQVEWSPQREQNLRNLTSAVQRMFGSMTLAFSQTPFEPQPTDPKLGVINFLAKFDAIFTLNQDTLLEQHYIPVAGQDAFPQALQWPGYIAAYRPGIVRALDKLTFGALDDRIELFKPDQNLSPLPCLQPYFKLHGSIDIKQSDREMMLVIGGNKAASIAEQPLLKWYHQEFQTRLRSPGARLMIIGYSFGDQHINEMIFSGIEAGLKIFIIDPLAADVIGSNPSLRLNPGFSIHNAIIGASRRPLLNALSGRDVVELNKINRFFRTGRIAVTYHPAL